MATTGFFLAAAASELATKAWAWLGQTVVVPAPASYELEVGAKTSDGFPVVVVAVYTVGPRIDDKKPGEEPLLLHAKLSAANKGGSCPRRVRMLIVGHVGAITSGSALDQILYMGSRRMMTLVLNRVQPDLRELGLDVYNAGVERISIAYKPHTEVIVTVRTTQIINILSIN